MCFMLTPYTATGNGVSCGYATVFDIVDSKDSKHVARIHRLWHIQSINNFGQGSQT